jgi:hypothetical protein
MNTQLTFFPEPTPSLKASASSPFTSVFDDFTLEQRKQIIAWNDKHTYEETIDLIQKNFGVEVSRSSLGRFYTRTALINHIEESPDTQAAADQILLHITSSKPNEHKLTAASLHILEQTAFKLALTSADKPVHLDLLNRVNLIICRARNTAVRERHATVQETKCALRSRELDLKALRLNPNLNLPTGGTSSTSPTPRWSEAAAEPSRTATTQTNATPSDQNQNSTKDPNPVYHVNPVQNPNPENQEPSVLSVTSSVPSVQPLPAPSDPSDDPFLHIEGLLNGTIKPSWIPAEIPCDEEETFLDVWLRNRLKDQKLADTIYPNNGS